MESGYAGNMQQICSRYAADMQQIPDEEEENLEFQEVLDKSICLKMLILSFERSSNSTFFGDFNPLCNSQFRTQSRLVVRSSPALQTLQCSFKCILVIPIEVLERDSHSKEGVFEQCL